MEVVSRREAKSERLPRYFTGLECRRGHISERNTGNGQCLACSAEAQKRYRAKNPEKVAAGKLKHREKNKEEIKAQINAYRLANKDRLLEAQRHSYRMNRDRRIAQSKAYQRAHYEEIQAYRKSYREKNRPLRAALQAKRKALEKQAVPGWFGEMDELVWLEASDLVHKRRHCTGIDWAADHMIPLASRTASGLHVWNNCQVIPRSLNQSKHNKMQLTQPCEWLANV